jgi:hypothetical protein
MAKTTPRQTGNGKMFEYPQQFAEDIFARVEHALRRISEDTATAAVQSGRLFIVPAEDLHADPKLSQIPDLSVQYVQSSDMQICWSAQGELL